MSSSSLSASTIYILGAGGHCLQVIDTAQQAGWQVAGLFDDHKSGTWGGIPILGPLAAVDEIETGAAGNLQSSPPAFHCAIGDNAARQSIIARFPHRPWPNVRHPQAFVSPLAKLGDGNYLGGGCRLLAGSFLGRGNILNEGCLVTHECALGDFNHLAPGSCLGGWVSLGDRNLVGLNATLLPRVALGDDNVVGAGAVVLPAAAGRDLSGHTMAGNPARVLSRRRIC